MVNPGVHDYKIQKPPINGKYSKGVKSPLLYFTACMPDSNPAHMPIFL